MNRSCAQVLLPVPVGTGIFTYLLPAELEGKVKEGYGVIVPFGAKRLYTGIILSVQNIEEEKAPKYKLKEIICLSSLSEIILPRQLQLWQWMSSYYMCDLGDVMNAALPSRLKKRFSADDFTERKKKNLLIQRKVKIKEDNCILSVPNTLNGCQGKAYQEIHDVFEKKDICLLHGYTSSGKTELYIHLMEEYTGKKKQILMLVPEIALTDHLAGRLKSVFGNKIGVYHSSVSDGDRQRLWNKMLSDNPYEIILGARSSVFLPYKNLGLIIIDEEHDGSYKQQDPSPRYNARNVALVLASYFKAKTLLGTATPGIESYYNVEIGKYGLVELFSRYGELSLPEIKVIDLHSEKKKKRMENPVFSKLMIEKIGKTVKNGKQVLLFQNRRGYAPVYECPSCGYVIKCKNCDVSMTYHKSKNKLVCHYCGKEIPVPEICPSCGSTGKKFKGIGTERVEEELRSLFPGVKVSRMDTDAARQNKGGKEIFDKFDKDEPGIMIGTQMVSKGLDFGNVHMVGIINVDGLLNMPDFRANERAFQLVTQVSGRAGRKGERGEVYIQSYDLEKASILEYVVGNDYKSFYEEETSLRKMFFYPPYSRIIVVTVKHRDYVTAKQAAGDYYEMLLKKDADIIVSPPFQPSVARVSGLFIRQFMIKMHNDRKQARIKREIAEVKERLISSPKYKTVNIFFDIDPE